VASSTCRLCCCCCCWVPTQACRGCCCQQAGSTVVGQRGGLIRPSGLPSTPLVPLPEQLPQKPHAGMGQLQQPGWARGLQCVLDLLGFLLCWCAGYWAALWAFLPQGVCDALVVAAGPAVNLPNVQVRGVCMSASGQLTCLMRALRSLAAVSLSCCTTHMLWLSKARHTCGCTHRVLRGVAGVPASRPCIVLRGLRAMHQPHVTAAGVLPRRGKSSVAC
jgi:hypothetical protein